MNLRANIQELYNSRMILKSLMIKYLFGRYRNSILGIGWHFITPAMLILVYYIAFTQIKENTIDEFWIFLASGVFPFHFFMTNIVAGSGVFVNNSGMIKKIYFPKYLLVIAQSLCTFIIMIAGLIILTLLMIVTNHHFSLAAILGLVPLLILSAIFAIGCSLILSTIVVFIRDLQYLLNSLSIVFYFLTPLYYSVDNLAGTYANIIWLNPLTYFIESYHQIIYYNQIISLDMVMGTLVLTTIAITTGLLLYTKYQHKIAEKV